MDNDTEVIREQMEETRASLTEKLETLEQQVVTTVQEATSAVAETVESVKEAVNETVTTVKDSVQETVASVKGTVEDTVVGVKETFDLQHQVEQHPWGMMAGSIALGYLGGYLLSKPRTRVVTANIGTQYPLPVSQPMPSAPLSAAPISAAPTFSPPTSSGPSWWTGVSALFGPEIAKVKGLALGVALGIVRDSITQAAPAQMKAELGNVIDSITAKLGGEPLQAPVLPQGFGEREEQPEAPRRDRMREEPEFAGFSR